MLTPGEKYELEVAMEKIRNVLRQGQSSNVGLSDTELLDYVFKNLIVVHPKAVESFARTFGVEERNLPHIGQALDTLIERVRTREHLQRVIGGLVLGFDNDFLIRRREAVRSRVSEMIGQDLRDWGLIVDPEDKPEESEDEEA